MILPVRGKSIRRGMMRAMRRIGRWMLNTLDAVLPLAIFLSFLAFLFFLWAAASSSNNVSRGLIEWNETAQRWQLVSPDVIRFYMRMWSSLAVASFTVFVWLLWRFWRRPVRPSTNCCVRCSYNLTGNVSGVCPECGKTIAEAK